MRKLVLIAALVAACNNEQAKLHADNQIKLAQIVTRKFAYEAYPEWAAGHAVACPRSLADLTPYMNSDDLNDPWGHPYKMVCGAAAPPAAKGFGVISDGVDGKPITSWDP